MENTTQSPTPPRPRFERRSDSWRAILVVAIFALLAAAVLERPAQGAREGSASDKTFSDLAFMSKVERRGESGVFKGGEVTAVMGGAEIDLSRAEMEGKEATLKFSAVMGGVTVRIPDTWTVVSNVDTVMSEFKNNTRTPSETTHRLILEGTVVMGGLKVTN